MLQLTLKTNGQRVPWESPNFRLSGGILSDCLPRTVIAKLVKGTWDHQGVAVEELSFTGGARLMFGLPRDPWRVSDEVRTLTLRGECLLAEGTVVAHYVAAGDVWRALARPMWWHSLHIVDARAWSPEPMALASFNPWRCAASERTGNADAKRA